MKLPFEKCPRFSHCSANVCPLDPDAQNKETIPGEAECDLGKAKRHAIGSNYPDLLPLKGLTRREFGAKQRYEALPEAKKAEIMARTMATRFKRRG